jgi:hypothetical protein
VGPLLLRGSSLKKCIFGGSCNFGDAFGAMEDAVLLGLLCLVSGMSLEWKLAGGDVRGGVALRISSFVSSICSRMDLDFSMLSVSRSWKGTFERVLRS